MHNTRIIQNLYFRGLDKMNKMANVWSLKIREGLIKDFIKICILIFIIMCTISSKYFLSFDINYKRDSTIEK